MLLKDILYKVSLEAVAGSTDLEISTITFDSRKVVPGTLFVAIPGTQVDGHDFIPKAIELGATAILCERLPETLQEGVTYIQSKDASRAMGFAASNFYGQPSSKIKLVGVTGTNGKTTTVTLLFRLFRALGHRCGLISTVQNQVEDEIIPSTHTTPDSLTLNALLAEMLNKGCTHVFMEVSSHAVVQQRIAGVQFAGGIFTNITHDHLDFHKTFDAYIKAKKGFFDQLPKTAFALVNADDPRGRIMVQNTVARRETYSLETGASFKGKLLADSIYGLEMEIDSRQVHFQLIGNFNAYNLLGVYGAAVLMDEDPAEVLTELSALQPPPGRFEQVISPDHIVGIVDFAHTPDALKNVLETIAELRQGSEQIITVVGCGGNRDATKRPEMARIACQFSDHVILTSDNPRNEEPEAILEDMKKGVPNDTPAEVTVLVDRREAIARAVSLAQSKDVILLAGKGHETYQDVKGVKNHFDDREELRAAFQKG
ncbi:UDP-N-acetylmuramoyl-L-alanyl-D-glutamate--2,6-diaminopimelate ligase [Siphonobacter sp.]|uniref:UDP-N-acetylmuramoyl-L-alanyl-D-glutamate--2, 6-diaminopimelate ligase n=1 Tax=Siphonobacter sp. TaxID=1869184 RepID=UPI003B3BBD94